MADDGLNADEGGRKWRTKGLTRNAFMLRRILTIFKNSYFEREWPKFSNSSCVQCTRIKIIHTCYSIELHTNRLLFMIRVTSICEK